MAEVFKLRDQRVGAERLRQSCVAEDPEIRRAAAQALGALRDRGSAATLGGLLDDPEPTVRYAAAFALGRLDPPGDAAQWLMPALLAEDPNLRLLAVRSLGFVGAAGQSEALLRALDDERAPVRGEAAIALARLCGDPARGREPAPGVGQGLTDTLRGGIADHLREERHPEARWRMCWALSQLAAEQNRRLLAQIAGEPSSVQRNPAERAACAFAIRGLGKLQHDEELLDWLLPLTQDRDPVVSVEAVRAAAKIFGREDMEPGPQARVALALTSAARSHPASATRAAACAGLGQLPPAEDDRSGLREVMEAACTDRSISVRMAALPAFVRQFGELALPRIQAARADQDWRLRVAAMRAAAELPEAAALTELEVGLVDDDLRVRRAALQGFERVPLASLPEERFARVLGDRDIAMRETLAEVMLSDRNRDWAVANAAALGAAFADSPGPEFAEARKMLLQAALELAPDSEGTQQLLANAAADPNQVVRRAAAAAMAARGEDVPPEMLRPDPVDHDVPGAGIPIDFLDQQPVIRLVTDKGEIDIALIPQLAPTHCWNLMKLAAVGHYDGSPIHRVVANFVVQGGDLRGDGYGNAAWHGGTLRDEINELPFTTGTLGAPRTADPDTAGGQFFITLLPTPWLDGEYSAFGRVVRGMTVVEAIEVGDVVRQVGLLVEGQ